MEKYLPQTKLQKFLGMDPKINHEYFDFRMQELQTEIDKGQIAMRDKKCAFSPTDSCCAEECAHFKDGTIKHLDVGFLHPEIEWIKFSPSCKLWSE